MAKLSDIYKFIFPEDTDYANQEPFNANFQAVENEFVKINNLIDKRVVLPEGETTKMISSWALAADRPTADLILIKETEYNVASKIATMDKAHADLITVVGNNKSAIEQSLAEAVGNLTTAINNGDSANAQSISSLGTTLTAKIDDNLVKIKAVDEREAGHYTTLTGSINGVNNAINEITSNYALKTAIPTKLSDLTNDGIFITMSQVEAKNYTTLDVVKNTDLGYLKSFTETDPTVPAWAKEATKPTYSIDEITGLTAQIAALEDRIKALENPQSDV